MVPPKVEPSYRPEPSDGLGVLKSRNYKPQYSRIIIDDQMFLVRAGSSNGQAILLPRRGKISDADRMPHTLIFTSIRRNSFRRWLVVLAHTLPDRRDKNHVSCQPLRMEPSWSLLPSQRCGGEHSTRYSYTPTSSPKDNPQDCTQIVFCISLTDLNADPQSVSAYVKQRLKRSSRAIPPTYQP